LGLESKPDYEAVRERTFNNLRMGRQWGEMSIHAETYAKDLMSHFQSAIADNKSVPIEVSEIYKLQTQDEPY
ncbi:hypothetical protein GNF11_36135, partial [Nostoc sp. UCD122]|nr:hypothetical protein [Nostoc sp. UCD122]